jgi:hypothetical protein
MCIKKLMATIVLATGTFFSYSQSCGSGINYWLPSKSSLRIGYFDTTHLKADSIGCFSGGFGNNVLAKGYASFATGYVSYARGNYSMVNGYFNIASGAYSLALGRVNQALGYNAAAIGNNSISKSYGGVVVGMYNDTADSPDPNIHDSTDRIFQIGNGYLGNRSNALTVLRKGWIGIGVPDPNKSLSINGGMNIDYDDTHIAGSAGNNMLTFGSYSGEGIGSDRSSAFGKWGLNFYTNFLNRMAITNTGDVAIGGSLTGLGAKLGVQGDILATGNIKVQNNKGIVRSSNATQQKIVYTDVSVTPTISADGSLLIGFNWSESFTSAPSAFVGNIVVGVASTKLTMHLSNCTTTGGQLSIGNTLNIASATNFTIRIIAIGAQ